MATRKYIPRHAALRGLGLAALTLLLPARELPANEPWAFTAPVPRRVQADLDTAPIIEQASKFFLDAQQAFVEGQWKKAEQLIQKADATAPGSPIIIALAGRIYNNTESFGLALEAWDRLLEQYPNHPTFLAERSGTLMLLNRDAEAEKALRRAVRFAPTDLTTHYFQIMGALRNNDLETAGKISANLTNPELLEISKRLLSERKLVTRMAREAGFAAYAKALFSLPDTANPDTALPTIADELAALKQPMQSGNWTTAILHLQNIRKAGAAHPALYYDLSLCAYFITPSDKRLDDLEKFVASERGHAFARYYIYLSLFGGHFDRALHIVNTALGDAKDEEATLLRAAIAYGTNHADEAWKDLDQIPLALRPATDSWFARDIPVIRAIKEDPRYERWKIGEP
ncbi:MAG: hypothetical protein M9963_12255 [Kiritimatiellae bacterium]|nr:hypothetical protein [Kiritimatiellia bacterium]MCO5062744.1 hypothetical protein [Kiritimatiellia bacterium]MCO5067089.1 hypothetical protein [Kiritimatiellia bacterium]MCO6400472.1 hypothetical protein [Verrucomicrobiota bacterium]